MSSDSNAVCGHILNAMGHGILIMNAKGDLTDINQAALDLLGWQRDDALGKPLHTVIYDVMPDGSSISANVCPLYQILEDHQEYNSTSEVFWSQDGTVFPVDLFGRAVLVDGQLQAAVITFQDISVRKDTELRLRESEERTRLLVETALDGIITIDSDSLITGWNPQAEQIFGWTAEEVNERPLATTIIPARFRAAHQRGLENFLNTGEGKMLNERTEITGLHRDGHEIDLEISITPFRSGGAYTFGATVRDITDRKRMQKELEEAKTAAEDKVVRRTAQLQNTQEQLLQSEKMASLGQLAAGVAHEINNPIGFVMSNLKSLQEYIDFYQKVIEKYDTLDKAASNEERHSINDEVKAFCEEHDLPFVNEDSLELLHDSIDGTRRVRDIVKGLKEFSHTDQGGDLKEADINNCLETTLKIVNNQIKYSCEIQKKFRPLPHLHCNAGQLNQVFMNLLINAGQAISEKGIISVETSATEDSILVMIADNGAGIPQENLNKLFDPFFTTKPVGEGTGLGLSISYNIVKEHGGEIRVQSQVGKGTRFIIRLPFSR